MIDRRDFDEWWERERIRNGGAQVGADYKHWAEKAFFAAQDLIRAQVLNRHRTEQRAALLHRVNS